jgi:hypothetical protein
MYGTPTPSKKRSQGPMPKASKKKKIPPSVKARSPWEKIGRNARTSSLL